MNISLRYKKLFKQQGENVQSIINESTTELNKYYKKEMLLLIVLDLSYDMWHSYKSVKNISSLSRITVALVKDIIPLHTLNLKEGERRFYCD
ncbi:hypothetical protein K4L44_17075 [Halosquirtibacter laminarini]|uniref:Uncharacterized protein n=1 Tax=Halosquirtibacter laminarini TaxID=3374600 RepID=A0AC61NPF1_9BACT|nr:hypothetical protein K4L44_17075 [Prolixibacteraceae bacterium]